jgi:pSer/pThr/pTyr-binding forkhead associated (FHA) protein
MPLRFRILPADGTLADRTFELTEDTAEVRLGRQPSFELELPFPAVSVFHARLFRGESAHEWWLEDQGSTNGTWLEEQRLAPRRPALIRAGQRMRIGSVDIVFEGWAPTVKGDESTATIARRLISDLFSAPGNDAPTLALQSGRAQPATLSMTERDRRYLVGRAETSDIVLGGDHASREHAVFERRWDGVFLSDLGSRNGVLINGGAATGRHRLRDGDSVQLGGATFRLTDPEDRYLRRLEAPDGGAEDDQPKSTTVAEAIPPAAPAARNTSVSASRATAEPRRTSPAAQHPREPSDARPAVPPPRPGLSTRRKLAMAIAAGVLIIAVAGLVVLLVG